MSVLTFNHILPNHSPKRTAVQIITKVGGTPPKLDATPEESDQAAASGSQRRQTREKADASRLANAKAGPELPSSSRG